MDKKELQLLGKQRDNLISSLYASYEATLSKAQGVLFKQFAVEIMDKLEYDEDGKVINNAKNRNVLVSLDKFFKKWNDDTNPRVLNVLLEGVQQIMNFNYGYYSKFNEVPKASLIKLREKALSNVRGWLGMEDNDIKPNGYLDTLVQNDTIKNQIKDAVMKTIYAQDGWNAAKKTLQTIIEGDGSGSLGSLEKYHRNFSYDLYSQIDRATGKTYADDLKFDCAIYEGGIIETSRPFCKEHNGKVYHITEIREMKPESGIPPNYNPLFDMGGYGCRHHWNWIPWSLAIALRPEITKFREGAKSEEKPTEEKPKPIAEKPKKEIEVKPIEKPKADDFANVTTKEFKSIVANLFPIATKVVFSGKDYDAKKMQETLTQLSALSKDYPMTATIIEEIKFRSGSNNYGQVSSYVLTNKVASFNVGHNVTSIKNRSYNEDDFIANFRRSKSVVDSENIGKSTLTHEFAHLITSTSRGQKTESIKDFWIELKAMKKEYHAELNDLVRELKTKEATEIFLGEYAGTNADEFLAEGFTEYKLRKNPSKYAKKVGKLFDKYFKK